MLRNCLPTTIRIDSGAMSLKPGKTNRTASFRTVRPSPRQTDTSFRNDGNIHIYSASIYSASKQPFFFTKHSNFHKFSISHKSLKVDVKQKAWTNFPWHLWQVNPAMAFSPKTPCRRPHRRPQSHGGRRCLRLHPGALRGLFRLRC